MKEKHIQNAIRDYIRSLGYWCTCIQSGAIKTDTGWIRMADAGCPDIVACIPDSNGDGIFIAIEVKKDQRAVRLYETGKDSTHTAQRHQHELIRQAGGIVLVATSIDEVQHDLYELGLISSEQMRFI